MKSMEVDGKRRKSHHMYLLYKYGKMLENFTEADLSNKSDPQIGLKKSFNRGRFSLRHLGRQLCRPHATNEHNMYTSLQKRKRNFSIHSRRGKYF